MKRVATLIAVLGLAAGCTPPPQPAPAELVTENSAEAEAKRRRAEAKPSVKFDVRLPVPPTVAAAPADRSAAFCEAMCQRRQMARPVGAELIAAKCKAECSTPDDADTTSKACGEDVQAARATVERVAMRRRAPKVWAALADPKTHCGYSDPFIKALGKAAVDDLTKREEALARALGDDPFFATLCPGQPDVLQKIDTDALDVFAVAEACGLPLGDASPQAHRDIGPWTYLAVRAVSARWEALGLRSPTHRILLNILLLASALEGESARP